MQSAEPTWTPAAFPPERFVELEVRLNGGEITSGWWTGAQWWCGGREERPVAWRAMLGVCSPRSPIQARPRD